MSSGTVILMCLIGVGILIAICSGAYALLGLPGLVVAFLLLK